MSPGFPARARATHFRHREVIQRAQAFIEHRLAEHITPEDIAEQAGVSASHLFAVFARHIGYSPIRYQADLRLRAAMRRLLEGQSVTATAQATGFASLHYFSRLFRTRYGASPSKFVRRVERK